MQYNFESIADDLLIKFEKRLLSNQKAVIKQMGVLFDFLGDRLPFEMRKQLEQVITDIASDGDKSQYALFTQTLHKMVRAIREQIKE